MKTVMILDTETTGLDPKVNHPIEIGVIRWSVECKTTLYCASWILKAPEHACEEIHGIPQSALEHGMNRDIVNSYLKVWAKSVDAILAHNAEFDRQWVPDLGKPWICTKHDLPWPGRPLLSGTPRDVERPGKNLRDLALAHGIGVSAAHRALADCFIIAQLLERVAEMGHDITSFLNYGLRPKATFQALVSYEDRELAKQAGFYWERETKRWLRTMAIEDIANLVFGTQQVEA